MTDSNSSQGQENWWGEFYQNNDELPWDTGQSQPQLTKLVGSDVLTEPVLDVGCGIGTEALFLAEQGYSVVGIDFAQPAIERARTRASKRTLEGSVAFTVGDVLDLSDTKVGTFETVLDIGMFHTLDPGQFHDYITSLDAIIRPGGHVVLIEFGADAPIDWGPNPVSAAEIRSVFTEGWDIDDISATTFQTQQGDVPGIFAQIRRIQ